MADTYTVTREITIDAPPAAVYEQLADFRRWRTWSPFEELDPGMDRTYRGADSGVGAAYEWAGKPKAGSGTMIITAAEPGSRVVVGQQNHKPFRSQSTSTFSLAGADGGTLVSWSSTGTLTRMMRVMGVVMSMEKVLGPVFEKGLAKLKERTETTDRPGS